MFLSRRQYLSLLGVVAWSATVANTSLDIFDATSYSGAHAPYPGMAIAASVLDSATLGSVTVFSIQYAWTRGGIIKHALGRRSLAIGCVVFSAGAMIVSLVSIAIIKSRLDELAISNSRATGSNINWRSQASGHIAAWVLACLSQIVLFSSPLWSQPKPEVKTVIVSGPRDSVMSEIRDSNTTTNLYMLQPTQPSSPLAALPSPTFSARSSNSLKSWRDSLQFAVRPVTSRTKLIKQPSFTRDTRSIYSNDNQSIETSIHPDGFDSWEVDPYTRDAVVQLASTVVSTPASTSLLVSAPSRGTVLEPIPGSRPASPARALDGPFPSSGDDDDDSEFQPPPKMMPDTSRPPSPAVSEAHIHPLFRTESPTPPPAATPGTNILASPLATQMIACPTRPYNRMRSNSSRAASPSPLYRTVSSHGSSSRSPSPPSREMTPPIPDFVLSSSPRSSTSHSRRKVNLQPDNGW